MRDLAGLSIDYSLLFVNCRIACISVIFELSAASGRLLVTAFFLGSLLCIMHANHPVATSPSAGLVPPHPHTRYEIIRRCLAPSSASGSSAQSSIFRKPSAALGRLGLAPSSNTANVTPSSIACTGALAEMQHHRVGGITNQRKSVWLTSMAGALDHKCPSEMSRRERRLFPAASKHEIHFTGCTMRKSRLQATVCFLGLRETLTKVERPVRLRAASNFRNSAP
jgi:hypothetical protein